SARPRAADGDRPRSGAVSMRRPARANRATHTRARRPCHYGRILALTPADREPSRFAAGRQPNTPGLFRPPQHGHALRTGTVRGPGAVSMRRPARANRATHTRARRPCHYGRILALTPADREPSRFAAGRQPNTPGLFRPPQHGHALRTGTVRGPGAVSMRRPAHENRATHARARRPCLYRPQLFLSTRGMGHSTLPAAVAENQPSRRARQRKPH